METRLVPATSPGSLDLAASILSQGGLVAFPTDTVYGLGAVISDPLAIDRLYEVKARDTSKAIAVLIGDIQALEQVGKEMTEIARRLSAAFWPGPLTLVVSGNPALPDNLSASKNVGIRMPNHPLALELLKLTGPLAATSANLSGMPDTRTALQVFKQLGGRIPFILDGGETPGGEPSTVVDCTGRDLVILRQGPVTLNQLKSVIN